jgi:hypothetical protein
VGIERSILVIAVLNGTLREMVLTPAIGAFGGRPEPAAPLDRRVGPRLNPLS